jgi:hypothetical protein
VHVDAREDFGVGFRTLGLKLYFASADLMAASLQYQNNIESGTASGARQKQFHGARGKIASARIRRPIHAYQMAAAGLGNKAHPFMPAYGTFHAVHSSRP